MTDGSRRERLTEAYERFCAALMAILYEEDPAEMGSSVGAPKDEYAQEASVLAVRLKQANSKEAVTLALQQMFPDRTTDPLVSRVHKVLSEFSQRIVDANHRDDPP